MLSMVSLKAGVVMELIALILMTFGVLSITGHDVLQGWILRKKTLTVRELLIAQHGISTIMFICGVAGVIFLNGPHSLFHSYSTIYWVAVVGTTVTDQYIQYAKAKSRDLADVSLTAPIAAMTPGLVIIPALFLGEQPSFQGYTAIWLIMMGNYVHARENATTFREYLQPFTLFKLPANFTSLSETDQIQARKDQRAIRWAYGSALMGTFGLISDGLVPRNGSMLLGFGIEQLALTLTYVFLPKSPDQQPQPPLSRRVKTNRWKILSLGLFFGLRIMLVMTSFRFAKIAYIGSLKRLAIVLTVLLSWKILDEKKAPRRLWPALVITLGAMLLALDGTAGRLTTVIEKKLQ